MSSFALLGDILQILGSGMSAKMWEVTIEHARTCVLDQKVYLYYSPVSQHSNGVVFNVVGQITGLYSETQYIPVDKMSESDKAYSLYPSYRLFFPECG